MLCKMSYGTTCERERRDCWRRREEEEEEKREKGFRLGFKEQGRGEAILLPGSNYKKKIRKRAPGTADGGYISVGSFLVFTVSKGIFP